MKNYDSQISSTGYYKPNFQYYLNKIIENKKY